MNEIVTNTEVIPHKIKAEDALKVALIFMCELSKEMNPTSMELALCGIQNYRPKDMEVDMWNDLVDVMIKAVTKRSIDNPMSKMFF